VTVNPNNQIVAVSFDAEDAAPTYAVSFALETADGTALSTTVAGDYGQNYGDMIYTFGEALEAGDYVLVLPAGSMTFKLTGEPFNEEIRVPFTVKAAAPAEDIALTTEMFKEWDSFGAGANEVGQAGSANGFDTLTQAVYGDMSVNGKNYADLSAYTALSIKVTEGAPRLLFNRQSMDDSSSDFLAVQGDGPAEYVTVVGEYYVYNLAKIVEDKGYAHLNCIKGFWVNSFITEPTLHTEATFEEVIAELQATGIQNTTAARAKNGKFVKNGQIVIVKDGKVFNAAGARIQK
ncbi:MAG: hypothetical protein KBT39_06205, partial [Bacteroidales bacterium]|nr:hypothetical protein [Bacteroidales bacterium]